MSGVVDGRQRRRATREPAVLQLEQPQELRAHRQLDVLGASLAGDMEHAEEGVRVWPGAVRAAPSHRALDPTARPTDEEHERRQGVVAICDLEGQIRLREEEVEPNGSHQGRSDPAGAPRQDATGDHRQGEKQGDDFGGDVSSERHERHGGAEGDQHRQRDHQLEIAFAGHMHPIYFPDGRARSLLTRSLRTPAGNSRAADEP